MGDEKYIIISAKNSENLSLSVNLKIKQGYKPRGGVCLDDKSFYQAMVLKDSFVDKVEIVGDVKIKKSTRLGPG